MQFCYSAGKRRIKTVFSHKHHCIHKPDEPEKISTLQLILQMYIDIMLIYSTSTNIPDSEER